MDRLHRWDGILTVRKLFLTICKIPNVMLELQSCLICSHSLHVRDLEFIVKSSEEHGSDIFRQILQAKCPSIYGHGLVKGISSFCALKGLHNFIMIHFPQCLKHLSLFLGNVDCAVRRSSLLFPNLCACAGNIKQLSHHR